MGKYVTVMVVMNKIGVDINHECTGMICRANKISRFSDTTAFEKEKESANSCLEPQVIITMSVPCTMIT